MSVPLHAFLVANREEILARSRSKLGRRGIPTPTAAELADGLPRFLDQLITVLGAKKGEPIAEQGSIAASATIHGADLLRQGLTVGQVVQDYGSICQSVTEVAAELHTAITAEEFQTFNRILDEAIAQAVTEYERQRDLSVATPGRGFNQTGHRLVLAASLPTPPSPPAGATTSLLPSVLLVDDDEDVLGALTDLLSGRYRVTLARDGAEALTVLRQGSFDLAIVDLDLPVVDGLSLVKTVHDGNDHGAPAFLLLSGQSDPAVKAKALALGTVDYMTKPFDSDELLARMTRILTTATREASLLSDAMTDSLTGLANYRCFAQNLDREVERSRRYGQPLSLITLDLDHMKVINDEHGHDAGDDAIKLIAKVLTEAVRSFELVARQGGDEFAIILPDTGASDARQLADRLHEAVRAQAVMGLKLSASIGLASWQDGDGAERQVEAAALLKASDEALYRAKRGGRNRVESDRTNHGR